MNYKIKTSGIVDPYVDAVDIVSNLPIFTRQGKIKDGWRDIIKAIDGTILVDFEKMEKSLEKHMDNPKYARYSYTEGVRLGIIDTYGNLPKSTEKLARLLGTDAEEPDFEHSLLEGEIFTLEEISEILSRFGCRHSFEIL